MKCFYFTKFSQLPFFRLDKTFLFCVVGGKYLNLISWLISGRADRASAIEMVDLGLIFGWVKLKAGGSLTRRSKVTLLSSGQRTSMYDKDMLLLFQNFYKYKCINLTGMKLLPVGFAGSDQKFSFCKFSDNFNPSVYAGGFGCRYRS